MRIVDTLPTRLFLKYNKPMMLENYALALFTESQLSFSVLSFIRDYKKHCRQNLNMCLS
jgi:hypothetical protein